MCMKCCIWSPELKLCKQGFSEELHIWQNKEADEFRFQGLIPQSCNLAWKLLNLVETWRTLNVHVSFKRSYARLVNLLSTFNLSRVSKAKLSQIVWKNCQEKNWLIVSLSVTFFIFFSVTTSWPIVIQW